MARCIVPGCVVEATNSLSIRLRRRDTSAIWAPNLDAAVCDVHATSGARVHVLYEATNDGTIETHVHAVTTAHPSRRTPIRHDAARLDDDLAAEITEKVRES